MRYLLICLILLSCAKYENDLSGNWQLTLGIVATDSTYKETSYDSLNWELIYTFKQDSIITHSGEDSYVTYSRYCEQIDNNIYVYVKNNEQKLVLHRAYLYEIKDMQLILNYVSLSDVTLYFNEISDDSLNRFIRKFE